MRRLGSLLLLTLMSTACAEGLTTATRKAPSPVSGQGSELKTTVLKPGAKPSAASSAPSSPQPSAPVFPEGPTSLISGIIRIDANYVIAAGGGNVIAAGGGNVIAAGGGNVIAAGGGNVIAAGGGNYRVLEGITVPLGTILPVKGMVVVPVSLVTSRQIGPAVMTDAQGHYEVAVPQSETGTFRAPGTGADLEV